jgi:hypothetical protein
MSKKRRPPATLPITGLKGILPEPAAPVAIEDMKERCGPLDPVTLEARDAQRDLGAELLLAIRQVKADLGSQADHTRATAPASPAV